MISEELMGIIAIIFVIGGCGCLLPILAIYFGTKVEREKNKRKTDVMLKAIENGQQLDPQMFAHPDKTKKNIKMSLLGKLKAGIIWGMVGIGVIVINALCVDQGKDISVIFYILGIAAFAVGVANIIFYMMGRKQLKGEMEAELEKAEAEAEKAKKDAGLASRALD